MIVGVVGFVVAQIVIVGQLQAVYGLVGDTGLSPETTDHQLTSASAVVNVATLAVYIMQALVLLGGGLMLYWYRKSRRAG